MRSITSALINKIELETMRFEDKVLKLLVCLN